MIKLTFQLARMVERVYESSRVVIGLDSPDLADIPLDTSNLQTDHLVILDSDGEFWALNQVNDPFVTVNGRPFGRKLLRNGDRIVIGDVAVAFEGEAQSPKSAIETLVPVLERKIHEHRVATERQAKSRGSREQRTHEQQEGSSRDDREVVALLNEVEALAPASSLKVAPVDHQIGEHDLFDTLLSEVAAAEAAKGVAAGPGDSVKRPFPPFKQERGREDAPSSPPDPGMSWNMLLAMGAAVGLLVLLVIIGVFAAFTEQSDQQQYLAAQNVSDVAMALTYAQVHQVKPQNQNWTDPDFILANVEKVLDGHFVSLVGLDAQGYLKDNPYLLRIYTNHDASQFLLMAQPVFNLWHWFSRQHTILLDSTTMELRRTTDLRVINRLMANQNALTGSNALEVSRVVGEAELISLKALAKETHHRDLIPPRELRNIRPGSENLIHNAPRYYRFGEPVLEALSRANSESTAELKEIGEQLQRFQRLSRLVLYSGDNQTVANRALKALKKHFPNESMLIGYLVFQPQTGAYVSSQLLSEELPETKLSYE